MTNTSSKDLVDSLFRMPDSPMKSEGLTELPTLAPSENTDVVSIAQLAIKTTQPGQLNWPFDHIIKFIHGTEDDLLPQAARDFIVSRALQCARHLRVPVKIRSIVLDAARNMAPFVERLAEHASKADKDGGTRLKMFVTIESEIPKLIEECVLFHNHRNPNTRYDIKFTSCDLSYLQE